MRVCVRDQLYFRILISLTRAPLNQNTTAASESYSYTHTHIRYYTNASDAAQRVDDERSGASSVVSVSESKPSVFLLFSCVGADLSPDSHI